MLGLDVVDLPAEIEAERQVGRQRFRERVLFALVVYLDRLDLGLLIVAGGQRLARGIDRHRAAAMAHRHDGADAMFLRRLGHGADQPGLDGGDVELSEGRAGHDAVAVLGAPHHMAGRGLGDHQLGVGLAHIDNGEQIEAHFRRGLNRGGTSGLGARPSATRPRCSP